MDQIWLERIERRLDVSIRRLDLRNFLVSFDPILSPIKRHATLLKLSIGIMSTQRVPVLEK